MPDPQGSSLIDRDRGLLWHPYAPLNGSLHAAVLGASGVRLDLETADGSRVEAIDAMSSWWSAVHGYGDPRLRAAMEAQHARFDHVMFGGLTHAPAVELAERLVEITPDGLEHVFLADSGSVCVEVALKLTLQVQRARGHTGRRRILSLRGAYHGDTSGAMSVCDPEDGMHAAFTGLVAEQRFAPRPPLAWRTWDGLDSDPAETAAWLHELERLEAVHGHELAGIIVEPVLQGAGGMRPWSPTCLRALREFADRHRIPLIADEIATGFGRTGPRFAVDWAGVVPDLLCLGKALTGGTMTLAALVCSADIAAEIGAGPDGALMHGPTFMGNPLACAVATASVDLLEERFPLEVPRIERALAQGLGPGRVLAAVRDVRVLGAIGVLELRDTVDVDRVTRAALDRGVWLRPFRNLVYTMPPYVTTDEDVAHITAAMLGAVDEVHGR